jgi:glycyl-tRNA synthetase beta chain
MDDALLDEVAGLVEWPVAVDGRFDERYLALPREVLVSTLQEHQRYFPVEHADGRLTASFITISNIESRDPAQVRAGNERVVRPRLADAAFFWEQDRRAPLAARQAGLDAVTFQAKLGSIGDKVRRIDALAAYISGKLGFNVSEARRCASLAKCDLLSGMVGEFPDLQGVMGSYYAAADGEPAAVAAGIREHYQPRGAGDALPESPAGIAVALADRLDTLAGIFAIGQKPSGTRDPFGLRRAAIGVLRIVLEKRLDLDLRDLVGRAVAAQPVASPTAATELMDFILERLRTIYLERAGARLTTEMFDAVTAASSDRPLDIDARLAALAGFLERPEAGSLAAANKRIANILRKSAEAPGEPAAAAAVDASALALDAERALHTAVEALRPGVTALLGERDYGAALAQLAGLRPQIDAFFDTVMVNDPDPALRRNRMALVAGVRALFGGVADLSRLPG